MLITGGSGVDIISSGGGNDTLTGGAGNDTFNSRFWCRLYRRSYHG